MKNPAAVALGKLGGMAGNGAAKARTSEQARAAVATRWAKTKRKPKRVARRSVGRLGPWGKLEMSQTPPLAWMPLPEPPNDEDSNASGRT